MSDITLNHEQVALELPGKITPTALVLPHGLGEADIDDVIARLETGSQSINWWRGDVFVYAMAALEGEARDRFGKMLADDSTLRVYKSVAEAFPPAHRYARNKLAWAAHRALVRVKGDAERWKFAEMAALHGWSEKRCTTRAMAWNAGDLGAITEKWVPTAAGTSAGRRVTPDPEDDVGGADGSDGDSEVSVFDATQAGAAMAAEDRCDHDAPRDGDTARAAASKGSDGPTQAGQKLLDAVAATEAITAADEFDLRVSTINAARVMAAARRLAALAEYMDPSLKSDVSGTATESGPVREDRPDVPAASPGGSSTPGVTADPERAPRGDTKPGLLIGSASDQQYPVTDDNLVIPEWAQPGGGKPKPLSDDTRDVKAEDIPVPDGGVIS